MEEADISSDAASDFWITNQGAQLGVFFVNLWREPTLEHAFELIITVAIAVLGSNGLWAFIQSRSTAKSARDRMILGLGHAEIFRQAEHYIRRNGITTEELEDLNKYLFKPYKEMGGNGTAETIVKKCSELPIISRTEAERRDESYERISDKQ